MNFSFQGEKVLVTGGAGGLGTSIVKKFVESGATVYALDCSKAALEKLKSEIPAVQTVEIDLTDWGKVRKIVEEFGPMNHLVNNAAIIFNEPILDVTEGTLDKTLNTNFKAAFNLSQIFCKNVIAKSIHGATIVNVSSIASLRARYTGSITYSCSKAAVNMMTKSFAVEMGPHDIRVNAVLPSAMDTPLFKGLPREFVTEVMNQIASSSCMKQILDIDDAANLIVYLSSPLSKMITGTCIPVDGGILAVL